MDFMSKAPPSLLLNGLSVLNLVLSAITGFSELRGKNLPYSKFFAADQSSRNQVTEDKNGRLVSSRTGMLICYVPALMASLAFLTLIPNESDLRMILLTSALVLHFFKRVFEVILVHKYSGNMAMNTAITISFGYASSVSTLIYAQHLSQGLEDALVNLKLVGIFLFVVGILGNLYHHRLLSRLRHGKRRGEKKYEVPRGGLFNWVTCPHYLFEIMVFVGMSFISQTPHSFSVAAGTGMYLAGRSCATWRWYRAKFEDFPSGVKALVPFVL